MATSLCTCLRRVAICPLRCWQNGYMLTAAYAKGPITAVSKTKVAFEVEKDPHKLVNYLCGGNIYKTGEEIELKPVEEYPDWLWELSTDKKAPDLDQLEYGSYEYWAKAKKISLKTKNDMQKLNAKKKHKKF